MKKSLIALAALAAVSAASAQSSVTLYGLVDIGYATQTTDRRDGNNQIKSRGITESQIGGSRIGFRGVEDLGGGLKANFVVEQGISPTSPNLFNQRIATAGHAIQSFPATAVAIPGTGGQLSGAGGAFRGDTNRQSYLGLSSASMGTVNIGYQYTNAYELGTLSGYNAGTESSPGADKSHLHGTGSVGGIRSNSISYISPAFAGGFTVRAQYGSNGANAESATIGGVEYSGRRASLMLQYANGPLSAAIAYTQQRNLNSGSPSALASGNTTPGVAGIAGGIPTAGVNGNTRTANLTQVGASYDFGVVKVMGTYNDGKDDGVAASTSLNNKFRSYQLGVSAPFGAFVPFVSVGKAKTTEQSTGTITEDYKQAQVGVRYSLSKRTTAFAIYGRTTNDGVTVGGTNDANVYVKDTRSTVGISHSF